MNELILTKSDFQNFRSWLNLNLDGLTWQGRFKKEFEQFWDSFFEENLSLKTIMIRFDYAYSQVRIGALSSWFLWLRDKFLNYLFIYKNKDVGELSNESGIPAPMLATILRNYFLDEFPHLDQYLSQVFQVGNVLSPNLKTSFNKIKLDINITPPPSGSRDDEIMPSMEVTLFDEWSLFLKRMKADFSAQSFNLDNIKDRTTFVKQLKIVQDVSLLLLIFTISIYLIMKGNLWYEKNLANKVSVYEPQFSWLDKSGLFKSAEKKPLKEFKLNFNEIKDITKGEEINEFFDPEKYEEESEVELTSFDNIPRDLNKADREASEYEGDAENPNGYRETTGGTTRVYRLMSTSTNTYLTRDQINELVAKYKAEPVGDSKPGNDVPGGVYYNIYVPRESFKDFMAEVMQKAKGKLFESRTSNVKNVPGKTRVFIMVKSI
jgi:hypothetical protein